jgi:hypothetical protein
VSSFCAFLTALQKRLAPVAWSTEQLTLLDLLTHQADGIVCSDTDFDGLRLWIDVIELQR